MKDGETYYVTCWAVNGAGLRASFVTRAMCWAADAPQVVDLRVRRDSDGAMVTQDKYNPIGIWLGASSTIVASFTVSEQCRRSRREPGLAAGRHAPFARRAACARCLPPHRALPAMTSVPAPSHPLAPRAPALARRLWRSATTRP